VSEQEATRELLRGLVAAAGGNTDEEELDSAVRTWLAKVSAAWPEIKLPEGRFVEYVARHWAADLDAKAVLSSLHPEDLYLCCACVDGNGEALAAFDRHFMPLIRSTLIRLRLGQALREELEQAVRVQLMVGEEGKPPLISRFSGLGPLQRWLRIVTARIARRRLGREKRLMTVGDAPLLDRLAGREWDVELAHLKRAYRDTFIRVLGEALVSLTERERNLLRYRFVDGLGLEQIGGIYRVHHSTIHRWIQKIQQQVLSQTEQRLAEELNVDQAECGSIIALVKSQFDLTLETLLQGVRSDEE
jgi:RNA polymerase sigma-70 factor (ECF subfamily)